MNRIPTLDGWRGMAIALVLIDHIQDSLMHHYARPWTETGYHGVTFFFVLSGYLITSKLLEGPINFKRFYLRRFFRLMPVAWVFLVVLLLLNQLTGRRFTSLAEVVACVFFYRNFLGWMGVAGHFWSLSVEEQFYVLWPITLLLARRKLCLSITILGALGSAVFRGYFWSHYTRTFPTGPTLLHADGLLIGCLTAIVLSEDKMVPHIKNWSRYWVLPALGVLAFCMYIQREEWLLLEKLSIAGLIAATTLHPSSTLGRALSFPLLTWLGAVSYSVYIWQGLFMPFRNPLAIFILMPLVSLVSYYFIERPSTALGHRLTSSPQSLDPASPFVPLNSLFESRGGPVRERT